MIEGSSTLALVEVMPPPSAPLEACSDWSCVEAPLDRALPMDYREFISAYGTGYLDEFMSVLNPFSTASSYNLISGGQVHLAAMRQLREDPGSLLKYALFPEEGGLLPVAMTDDGDTLHWLTRGTPEEWPIVVQGPRAPETETFSANFTGSLAGLITGSIKSTIISGGLGCGGKAGLADFVPINVMAVTAEP